MRIIGIDTTRDYLTVVLINGDEVFIDQIKEGNKKHTSLLLSAIDKMLSDHCLKVSDVDFFSAIVGPGSFTGIRVGLATVNAMAFALQKKMIAVTALELIAYNKDNGVALIDALHGNYYGGTVEGGRIADMRYYEQGELAENTVCYYQDMNNNYGAEYVAILKAKAEKGEFIDSLMPLYLRESQAEREAKK